MSTSQALRGFLTGVGAVSALVAGRVYRNRAPQGETRTRLVYQRVSEVPFRTLEGEDGLWRARFQLNCWGGGAEPGAAAEALAAAVMTAFRNAPSGAWAWTDDAGEPQSMTVQLAQVLDSGDLPEDPYDGSGKGPEAVTVDVDIVFVRT